MAEIKTLIEGGMFDSTEIVETTDGYPRGNKAVDSAFFAKMISCFYADGVWGEESFKVTPAGGMAVWVSGGIAWCRGYMAWRNADTSMTLAGSGAYSIVLRLDTLAGEFSLVAKYGTEAPEDSEYIKELLLATVSIPTNATAISDKMISDKRVYVTSTVDALSTVENAQNAAKLGGLSPDEYLKTSGGVMNGDMRAKSDGSGMSVVRNIGYGTTLPDFMTDGDLFILLT
ncbi:MAG: hypothetical protein E7628_03405 [Ruminococcaceae bacterium]|nr:hypothetical protein [Oscillospiraceae bacterium]